MSTIVRFVMETMVGDAHHARMTVGRRGANSSQHLAYDAPAPTDEVAYGRPTVSPASAGVVGGGTRWCVACSNAYASPTSRGSLNARPENVTPAGPGSGLKPAGNAAFELSKNPPGTTMLG